LKRALKNKKKKNIEEKSLAISFLPFMTDILRYVPLASIGSLPPFA